MIFGLASALFWFLIFLVGHLVYFSVDPKAQRSKVILRLLAMVLMGHAVSAILVSSYSWFTPALLQGGMVISLSWGWLTILCLFVLYMPFYYAIDTSLSLQSLILVQTSGKNQYPIRQLQEVFVSRDLVRGRLGTMRENGYLLEAKGRYSLTDKGRFLAAFFIFFKRLWKLGTGG